MDQSEFTKSFMEILEKDSPRCNKLNSRTLLDREATVFAQHVWELCSAEARVGVSEAWLLQALLKTRGKFASEQERAAAMLRLCP